MATLQFESPLDRATFRSSPMFGGIDLMSARFVRHSFAPHSHDELMIGVMHAGVKSFRCGNARAHAAPGDLAVVNPGEMHTGEREHGRELAYAALYVPASALASILARGRDGEVLPTVYVHPAHGGLFVFAGLYETWAGPEGPVTTCAILTTGANDHMRRIHDRMPAILVPDAYGQWLAMGLQDGLAARALLAPWPDAETASRPVSTRVNNAQNEGAELIGALPG